MRPTDEQLEALRLFQAGDSMVIEAGAGTGKTSTLRLLAASTMRQGRYLAFNRAIVHDVAGTITNRVTASTAHSLAFRAVGARYAHRLNSGRMRSQQIADQLQLRPLTIRYGTQAKVLQPSYLAGWVMRAVTRYCQTIDEEPALHHFPYIDGIDVPKDDGTRTYDNNDRARAHCAEALPRAWADICRTDGQLTFRHDHYLKLWQLTHPRIPTDFILFDECQDANPVMAAVVAEQDHAQRVYVGDGAQAIYEFTGAINAIEAMRAQGHAVAILSQSFRFGTAIAEAANSILLELGSPLLLTGLDSIDSRVGEIAGDPDALLTRSNATAIEALLDAIRRGVRAHLVGGGNEVLSFARAAKVLQAGGTTQHPELACFTSWGEVKDYVRQDAQGGELALLVRLVDEFGPDVIERALDQSVDEDDAELVISTAHKAKGREWPTVRIAGDFADRADSGDEAEARLRYVAFTRARLELDETCLHTEETAA